MFGLKFQPADFARSYFCIALCLSIESIALTTIYVVLFDRPPGCEMLCPLMSLVPIITCNLCSMWLAAWHFPNWQQTARSKKASVLVILALAIAQTAWLFSN